MIKYLCLMMSLMPSLGFAQYFNFKYQIQSTDPNAPIQVFDDGRHTWIQFGGRGTPEIIGPNEKHFPWHLESPYLVIDEVLPCFTLQTDTTRLSIRNESKNSVTCTTQETKPNRATLPKTMNPVALSPAIAGAPLLFEVQTGERLSLALKRFLSAQGYTLEWASPQDFMIREPYLLTGGGIQDLLASLDSDYGLISAVSLNRVTVRTPSAHQ